LKIVFLMGAFSFGGAERVLCTLSNQFAEDGNDVYVVTLSHAEPTYLLSSSIHVINGLGWKNYFDGILKLRRAILKIAPDVVVSFLVQVNIAACMALVGTRIPLIVSERNDPKHMPPEKIRKILRRIFYTRANGYVFQTKEAAEYFSKAIQKKSTIIANPLLLNNDPREFDAGNHKMISVGRYVPQKNQALLIEAFVKATECTGNWELELFGEGDLWDTLQEQIHKLGADDRIRLHEPSNNLLSVLKTKAVFVLSSNFEGMPNALMEAMGVGLACISTDCPCGGPRYLIDDGLNGLLVPVGDVLEMSKSMKLLMEDSELREKLSREAVYIRNKLSTENINAQWKEYILKIMPGAGE